MNIIFAIISYFDFLVNDFAEWLISRVAEWLISRVHYFGVQFNSEKFPVWVKSGSETFGDALHSVDGNLIYANGFRFLESKAAIGDTDCQFYTVYF